MFGEVWPERTDADRDRERRCVATREQVTTARQMIRDDTDRKISYVLVPIAFPGKQRGTWKVGQAVEHPEGFEVVYQRGEPEEAAAARNRVEDVARAHLDGRAGVVGHVQVWRDGREAVFEGFEINTG